MDRKTSAPIAKYLSEVGATLARLPIEDIARVVATLEEVRRRGKRVFLFGNGGSANTASHFASDLCKGTIRKDKPRIKAFALTDNTALVTAWANDTTYEHIFAEQLENLIEAGDVAIAISGSGNSQNVISGVKLARNKGATTIGFIGFDGGALRGLVDISILVPSDDMRQVEDIHLMLAHIVSFSLGESRRLSQTGL